MHGFGMRRAGRRDRGKVDVQSGRAPHAAGWSRFGLATNDNALYTFSFLMLLYFAVFSVVSARERRWFWATMLPLPWRQTLAIFAYAMASCLVVNDAVKVAIIKWRVPLANPIRQSITSSCPNVPQQGLPTRRASLVSHQYNGDLDASHQRFGPWAKEFLTANVKRST